MTKQVKVRDVKAELLLIKTFCKSKKKGRNYIQENVEESLFGSQIGKLVWRRAQALYINRKLPLKGGWEILLADPIIQNNEYVHETLIKIEKLEVSIKPDFVNELLNSLRVHEGKRKVFDALQSSYDLLLDSEAKEDVFGSLSPILAVAQETHETSTADSFQEIGEANIGSRLEELAELKTHSNVLSTLWPQFDIINTGMSRGALWVIAGSTGGGKSAVSGINLLMNFAFQGLHVVNASLEMPEFQVVERLATYSSGIPLHKIRAYVGLGLKEKTDIEGRSLINSAAIRESGGAYWLFTPLKDLSIEEVLTSAYTRAKDVILVDYINLIRRDPKLDMKDGLGEIARISKNFAKNNNCLVILLAQLGADERVKYSKAVEEHADNVWIWDYPPTQRPGFIHVRQTKARNQVLFNFYLVEDFATMRVYDLLEPYGLALMLSKSTGMLYKKNYVQLFGEGRLKDIQKVDSIGKVIGFDKSNIPVDDWEDMTFQAIPIPGVPDSHSVIDMVREMIAKISVYDPKLTDTILTTLKEADILRPFKEFIDDIELPQEAKRQLEEISQEDSTDRTYENAEDVVESLAEAVESDLAKITDHKKVDSEKLADKIRQYDGDVVEEDIYSSMTKKKKKTLPSKRTKQAEGKNWDKVPRKETEKEKPNLIETGGNPLDGLKSSKVDSKADLVDLRSIDSKESLERYTKHWKKTYKERTPSIDHIRSHLENTGGPPPPSFLASVNPAYIETMERKLEAIGGMYTSLTNTISRRAEISVSKVFKNKHISEWMRGYKNEEDVKRWVAECTHEVCAGLQDIAIPKLTTVSSKSQIKIEKGILTKNITVNRRGIDIPENRLIGILSKTTIPREKEYETFNNIKTRSTHSTSSIKQSYKPDKILTNSPYVCLFKRPEYIGTISPNNVTEIDSAFVFNILKQGTFKLLLVERSKNIFKTLHSVSWALTAPKHRDNIVLLTQISECLRNVLFDLSKTRTVLSNPYILQ